MALIQNSTTLILDSGVRVEATVEAEGTDSQLIELSQRLRRALGPASTRPRALPANTQKVG